MTRVRARVVTAALVAVLAGVPATAIARTAYPDTPKGALNDCGNGNYPMKGHYTIKVLQQALKEIVAYKLQYTNCATILTDTIHKLELTARRNASGGGTSNAHAGLGTQGSHGGHGSGANPIGNKLHKIKSGGAAPVRLPGGATVTPGTVAARGSSFLSSLPTPLLIVVAALLAILLAVCARAINNLVRAHRPN